MISALCRGSESFCCEDCLGTGGGAWGVLDNVLARRMCLSWHGARRFA
jgi:hypothetical protein